MVDALVSFVVERLGDFLIKEAAFLKGVKSEVEWLKDELRCMQRFLKDADKKQYEDATICGWVFDIRQLAYDIEDLLDTFHLKIRSEGDDDDDGETTEEKPQPGCFPTMSCCVFHKAKEKVELHNIGKEIEVFKNKLNDLSRRRQLYGLRDSDNSGEERSKALGKLRELRKSMSFAVEQNVVGFQDDARKLLDVLFNNDPRRSIISIYGMGGLGKTTLVGKLYHNNDVKMRFMNCCAWVCVSQDYTTRDLLLRIIKSFAIREIKLEDLEKMDEADLGRYLHEMLQGLSYLLVIDDVWDKEAWRSLKRAFPDNKNGSRVIITTRIKEVAESADERTYAYNLRKLRSDESWQLFCEKTCQNFNADKGLKNLGREMLNKCDGLPLAIIVLGGLLSRKKPQEWSLVRDHLWQHLKDDSIEIHSLLALSFDCLPSPVKQCFLYLGLFPEDYEINTERLIHLWVAEDFIPQVQDYIMEEVAKGYMDELIDRSLIEVGKRYWGRIATCRVHDLLRDLAVDKAKNLNSLYICDEIKHSNMSSTISSCPRHAVYSTGEKSLWLRKSNPLLRSLFLFDNCQPLLPICKKFSSLRVLDYYGHIDDDKRSILVKEEIGKLVHLKYLGLRERYFNLSWSPVLNLSNLWRLQTLDLLGSDFPARLPAEICKLQEMRHLIGLFINESLHIDNLRNLQTLKYIQHQYWTKIKTEKLVNLRELWIVGEASEFSFDCMAKASEFSFDSMANLKSLRILSVGAVFLGSLQPLSHCRHLVELRLTGEMEKLPKNIHQLWPNLECLSLRASQLKDDPMPLLEKLPFLTILHLGEGFYIGEKIMCSAKGFLLLEILLFEQNYFGIEEWEVEEGALTRLRGLRIPSNARLTIPERLRSIPPPDPREYTNSRFDKALGDY
ncbi:hypothetical protein ACOSQ4_017621 [Xanthoceras sorbifolium]